MAENMSTASFIARAARLKMQEDYLNKSQAIAVKSLKCLERHTAQEIAVTYKEMECQRLLENDRLYHSLLAILQSLKELKSDVGNNDKLRQLELQHYRRSVFEMENKIRNFNETGDKRFQKLLEDEHALCDDIQSLDNKFTDWSQPLNPSLIKHQVRSVSKSYISNNDNTREEVLTFQKFLQDTGGHTGGWDEEDHLLYLRFRNKHKGKMAFLSLLKQHLPDISADEMLLHEDWFQQYETLKYKQKEAIQDWRAIKQKNSEENNTAFEPMDLNKRNKVECHEDSKEKKLKIEEWKKTLQLKKELESKKQWEKKQRELEREQERRERQALKKIEVERYKEEKLNQQQTKILVKQLKELREMEERAAQTNILRKAFRQQDQLFIARQINRRDQQMLMAEQRQKHLLRKEPATADRDPKRLLRPTAAWNEHCKQKPKISSSSLTMAVLHLRNMPHLQVPSWRKGMM